MTGGADNPGLAELQRLSVAAAKAGGLEAGRRLRGRRSVELKSDGSEVTDADIEIERLLVRMLREARPDDGFIGEEGASGGPRGQGGAAGVWWTIDPIDGTRNFIRGGGPFTCTVAALASGRPVAGSIYFPLEDTLYSASAGGGVTINGRPMRDVTTPAAGPRNPQPLVAIPSGWRESSGDFVKRLLATSVVRSFGCATAHLVYLAIGGIDATFMTNCKLWDIAAGWLIATEACLCVTRPDGGPLFPIDLAHYAGDEMPILAATPELHPRLVSLYRTLT